MKSLKKIHYLRIFIFFFLSGIFIFTAYGLRFTAYDKNKTIHDYSISVAGIKVGTLTATRETKDSFIIYSLSSNVKINMVKKYHIKDEVKSVYLNNIMQSATVITSVNKK